MPSLAPAPLEDSPLNQPLPKLLSFEGKSLVKRLEAAYKSATEYNKDALNSATYPKKLHFNAVEPTEFVTIKVNYYLGGEAEVPHFPIGNE